MNAAFTATPLPISVERYQKILAASVLTSEDRVELIEGEILRRAPIGSRHSQVVTPLAERWGLGIAGAAKGVPGGALDLGTHSEPQPDLILIRPASTTQRTPRPWL